MLKSPGVLVLQPRLQPRLAEILRSVIRRGGVLCFGFPRSHPLNSGRYGTGSSATIPSWHGAQFVLWSARGWSVPALARTLGCCRRTVRHWLYAFLAAGLAGVQGDARGRAPQRRAAADSARSAAAPMSGSRLVPVLGVSVPELRRILAFHWFNYPVRPAVFWQWSIYRRYKHALAQRRHDKKRGAIPPEFEQVRL